MILSIREKENEIKITEFKIQRLKVFYECSREKLSQNQKNRLSKIYNNYKLLLKSLQD